MPHQVCLDCRRLTANGSRCESCAARRQSLRNAMRPHYAGDYRKRSAAVRTAAAADPLTRCWLCGDTARDGDPWTADHVTPGDPSSILMPAHRSCNSSRGDERGGRRQRAMLIEERAR